MREIKNFTRRLVWMEKNQNAYKIFKNLKIGMGFGSSYFKESEFETISKFISLSSIFPNCLSAGKHLLLI